MIICSFSGSIRWRGNPCSRATEWLSEGGLKGAELTKGFVRKRTIAPQLIRIFCKLILRTRGTLSGMS
ncbi:hypothetical protein PSAB6_280014 [Paraburkholderia sabiae]|nr:hypothetical protein PSAB6_280014 [Paraburkholderia sabiae]